MVYTTGIFIVGVLGMILLGAFYKEVAATLAEEEFSYMDGEAIVMHLLLGLLILIVSSLAWPLVLLFGVGFLIRKAVFNGRANETKARPTRD